MMGLKPRHCLGDPVAQTMDRLEAEQLFRSTHLRQRRGLFTRAQVEGLIPVVMLCCKQETFSGTLDKQEFARVTISILMTVT